MDDVFITVISVACFMAGFVVGVVIYAVATRNH